MKKVSAQVTTATDFLGELLRISEEIEIERLDVRKNCSLRTAV
jgi:hypothetical protein